MTFWSESCVTQKRNSHITMKYSLAEHSCVQELNNMQQQTELAMWVSQLYPPTSFLKVLLKVHRNRSYTSYRWKKMNSRTLTLIKHSSVCLSTAHQSISTTNLKNNLHTVLCKLLNKYIDFYEPYIVKKNQSIL